jgi:hypothetical protein
MEIRVSVTDESVAAFSPSAIAGLNEAATGYAKDLIAETNRLEAGRNSAADKPEVTRAMVIDARDMMRRGLYTPKRSLGLKALRVSAAVLPLFVGIMYDGENLQNGLYMIAFIVVIELAILAVTLSVLKE